MKSSDKSKPSPASSTRQASQATGRAPSPRRAPQSPPALPPSQTTPAPSREPQPPAAPPAPEAGALAAPDDGDLLRHVLQSKWPAIAIGAVLLAGLTLAAYWPVLTASRLWPTNDSGFIWDDDDYVEHNQTLRSAEGLRDIWLKIGATPQYYPLVHTTFWLECQLGARDPNYNPTDPDRCAKPYSFHLVNILLHVANALLLWAVLRRLGLRGAYAAALLFAVHPVMVESAAWITERKNVLSLTGYLGAFLAYLRFDPFHRDLPRRIAPKARWKKYGRSRLGLAVSFLVWAFRFLYRAIRESRWVAFGLSLFLFYLALSAKTVTCTLPAALLLAIWWKRGTYAQFLAVPLAAPAAILGYLLVWRMLSNGWATAFTTVIGVALLLGVLLCLSVAITVARRSPRLVAIVSLLVLGATLSTITIWMEKNHVGAEGSAWTLSPVGRGLLAGRIAWFYAGKLFWPPETMFFYERWPIDPSQAWQYYYPAAALALVAALWLLRKRIGRGPLAAVLFFGITLFPALGFFSVYPMRFSYVADHFQYHAAIGIIVLAAGAVAAMTRLPAEAAATWRRVAPVAIRGAFAGLACGFLLYACLEAGRLPPAPDPHPANASIPSFSADPLRAVQLAGALGAALTAGGLLALLAWRLRGRGASALHLGTACLAVAATGAALALFAWRQAHDYKDRRILWTNTIAKNQTSWISWNNLGCIYMQEANNVYAFNRTIPYFDKAVEEYDRQKALEGFRKEDPNRIYDDATLNLGILALRKGEIDKANEYFAAGFALKPKHAKLRNKIGMVFWEVRRPWEALKYFQDAARIDPEYADAYNNIGFILENQGHRPEAIASYTKAIALQPGHFDAHFNLGMCLRPEDPNRALEEFQLALKYSPMHVKALDGVAEILNSRKQYREALDAALQALAVDGNVAQSLGIAADIRAAYPEEFRLALKSSPRNIKALDCIAEFLNMRGQYREALDAARQALAVDGNLARSLGIAASVLATDANARVRDGRLALEYAQRLDRLTGGSDITALDVLACAQAEVGDFAHAAESAQKAVDLATRAGRLDWAEQIRSRKELYLAGQTLRRGP